MVAIVRAIIDENSSESRERRARPAFGPRNGSDCRHGTNFDRFVFIRIGCERFILACMRVSLFTTYRYHPHTAYTKIAFRATRLTRRCVPACNTSINSRFRSAALIVPGCANASTSIFTRYRSKIESTRPREQGTVIVYVFRSFSFNDPRVRVRSHLSIVYLFYRTHCRLVGNLAARDV